MKSRRHVKNTETGFGRQIQRIMRTCKICNKRISLFSTHSICSECRIKLANTEEEHEKDEINAQIMIKIPSEKQLCKKAKPLTSTLFKDSKFDNIKSELNKIYKMLDIKEPLIFIYPIVFDNSIHGMGGLDDGRYMKEAKIKMTDLQCAFCLPEKNVVCLAYYDILNNAEPYPEKHILFLLLHELRHFWQYHHYHSKYYAGTNARGDAVINDNAEVDADAFAMAYYFHLGYTLKDLPRHAAIAMSEDNGKRYKECVERYKKYSPDSKIDWVYNLTNLQVGVRNIDNP